MTQKKVLAYRENFKHIRFFGHSFVPCTTSNSLEGREKPTVFGFMQRIHNKDPKILQQLENRKTNQNLKQMESQFTKYNTI